MHSILVADDHSVVRYGLKLLIHETLGSNLTIDFAEDGEEMLQLTQTKKYDALMMDINMPESDGLNLVNQILIRQPEIKILILSVNPEIAFAKRYLKAGAYGYVQKGNSDYELRKAIQQIFSGKRYVSPAQMLHFAEVQLHQKANNPFDALSEREFSAAALFLMGKEIAQIAEIMNITASTASSYKSRIFEKLNIENLMELAKLAKLHNVLYE